MLAILDSTTESLSIKLGAAVAANQPEWNCNYSDHVVGTSFTPGSAQGACNSTTEVEMAAAPAASNYRLVRNVHVYNKDTATIDVYITHKDSGGTDRLIAHIQVAAGNSAEIPTVAGSASGGTPDAHKDSHDPEDGSDPLDTSAASTIAEVQSPGAGTGHSFARADHTHGITHGIGDNHLVTVDDADAADDDYAKFTASGLEGRNYAEVRSDLNVSGKQNALINGSGRVAQRGTLFEEIDSGDYTLDRWYGLSDGDAVVDIGQSSTILVDGGYGSIYMSDAIQNKKFGLCQVIEGKDVAKLFKAGNGKASFSFDAKVTAGFDNVKAAVLAWDGAEDAPTGDWVSSWNGNGVTPSPLTNWKIENTPANLNVGTTAARYKIENIALDTASTKNLAVFIWNDDLTTPGGGAIHISRVKLEPGEVATDYEERPYAEELALSQRYCINWDLAANECLSAGFATTTAASASLLVFPCEMRVAPALTFSGDAHFQVLNRAVSTATTSMAGSTLGKKAARVQAIVSAGLNTGDGVLIRADDTGGRWVRADAEL